MPKEITVKEAQYAALYKNGLEVENASSYKNSNGEAEVSLKFNGEQVKYDAFQMVLILPNLIRIKMVQIFQLFVLNIQLH